MQTTGTAGGYDCIKKDAQQGHPSRLDRVKCGISECRETAAGKAPDTVNTEILLSLLTYIRGKRRMFLLRIAFWKNYLVSESKMMTSGLTPAVISIIRRVSAKRQSLMR